MNFASERILRIALTRLENVRAFHNSAADLEIAKALIGALIEEDPVGAQEREAEEATDVA